MSYEGFVQAICANGHYDTFPEPYDMGYGNLTCSICKASKSWFPVKPSLIPYVGINMNTWKKIAKANHSSDGCKTRRRADRKHNRNCIRKDRLNALREGAAE